MKKNIIVGIIVSFILGGAGYWYYISNQNESISFSLPFVGKSASEKLQGKWKIEQFFMFDESSQQFKAVPPEQQQTNNYLEFKDNLYCPDGTISAEGYPVPCVKYVPFTVEGQKVSVTPDGGASFPAFEWAIKDGRLELVISEESSSQKVKVVLSKFEASLAAKTMPLELRGVWKPTQFFEWDAATRQFLQVKIPSEDKNAYVEFREGFVCAQGSFNEQGAVMPCVQYQPAVFEGDMIRVGSELVRWAIKDGILELTFLADGGTPKEKSVWVKVP